MVLIVDDRLVTSRFNWLRKSFKHCGWLKYLRLGQNRIMEKHTIHMSLISSVVELFISSKTNLLRFETIFFLCRYSLQLNYFVFLKSQFIRIESWMTFFYSHFGKDETVKRTFYDLDQFCTIEYSVWRLVVFGSFFLRHLRIQCNRCAKCN